MGSAGLNGFFKRELVIVSYGTKGDKHSCVEEDERRCY